MSDRPLFYMCTLIHRHIKISSVISEHTLIVYLTSLFLTTISFSSDVFHNYPILKYLLHLKFDFPLILNFLFGSLLLL